MSWAAFIGAGVGSWVKKGAASLGIGMITYAGWAAIETQLSNAVSGMYCRRAFKSTQWCALNFTQEL